MNNERAKPVAERRFDGGDGTDPGPAHEVVREIKEAGGDAFACVESVATAEIGILAVNPDDRGNLAAVPARGCGFIRYDGTNSAFQRTFRVGTEIAPIICNRNLGLPCNVAQTPCNRSCQPDHRAEPEEAISRRASGDLEARLHAPWDLRRSRDGRALCRPLSISACGAGRGSHIVPILKRSSCADC